MSGAYDPDETDRIILDMLEANGRESLSNVAEKAGMSTAAVGRRIKKMIESGAIRKFTIERSEAGAIVLVSVDSEHDTAAISEALSKSPGIKTVYEITGQYDIACIIRAAAIPDINERIDDLRRMPGVSDTNTVIILRNV